MKRNDKITLSIGETAKMDLRILAAKAGVTISELVRRMIERAKREGKSDE